jgi:4-hydroxy-tetrahydrodipicolinate synthase
MATAPKKLHMIVISITPFDGKGRVDEPALRKHLGRLRDAGVSVFLCGSGTGEGYTLTPEEQDRIFAIGFEELKGKVPVFADGVEPRQPSEMVAFVRRAERAKVDAIRIFCLDIGHGQKPNATEMERYYAASIEAATSLPVTLTSHQAAGYVLPVDLIERLVNRYPQITRINVGTTDLAYLAEVINRIGDRIEVHCAGCSNGPTTLALGGNGFMGPEGNFAPTLTQAVINAYRASDMKLLQESYSKLMGLQRVLVRFSGSGRSLKPLMGAFGLPGGGDAIRPPRAAIGTADLKEAVKAVLKLNIPGMPEPIPIKD